MRDGAHSVTQAILFKHEWRAFPGTLNIRHMEDAVFLWARSKGYDPAQYLPLYQEITEAGPIYTFPAWAQISDLFRPLIRNVLQILVGTGKPVSGVVTRLALVKMPAGAVIKPHVDGQEMAAKAHRLHVSLTAPPGVIYKIGGRKFQMKAGHAYDFNNRMKHSVRHTGRRDRVNLFLDYHPAPMRLHRMDLADLGPLHTQAAPENPENWAA